MVSSRPLFDAITEAIPDDITGAVVVAHFTWDCAGFVQDTTTHAHV
jgi:hypothetical protein